ncbi:MAG: glycosyltransferase family 9 protein [Bacteroidia bacterium]
MKFLIIQTAFIGDVILATPVVEKLHRDFPGAEIDFLLRKGNEGLLTDHPKIRKLIIWDKKQKKFSNLLKLISGIRKEKYNYVINLHRFANSGIITAMSRGKEKIGFDKNPFSHLYDKKVPHEIDMQTAIHETERNLSLVEHIGEKEFAPPRLYPTDEDYKFTDQFKNKPYIIIAPASVWFTKQLPKEKWIGLIDKLKNNYSIFLIGAPTDITLCEEIKNASGDAALNLAGELSFLQSAALIRDATMNYVNDSAPLHIASAMNAPVTAVFCSTVPEFGFGPLSFNSTVVQTKLHLECKPCGLHGFMKCPLDHFLCAKSIEVEQLIN